MKLLPFHSHHKTALPTGILILVLLLAACAVQEVQTAEDKAEPEPPASFAAVERLDTKPVIEKDAVRYGSLRITLPDGVIAQQQKSDGNEVVIDFIGAEKDRGQCAEFPINGPLPPRIWLQNYHITYENQWELVSALLDLIPDTSLRRHKTIDVREYAFAYYHDKKNGYVLVHDDDIYIVEELSAEWGYSFGEFLDEKAVLWEDTQSRFALDDKYGIAHKDVYDKIAVEPDYTLLAMQTMDSDKTRRLVLFRDGYFTSADAEFSFIESQEKISFTDCNFDGYLDMVASDTERYLWNTDKKEYEAVQVPEGNNAKPHKTDEKQKRREQIPQALLDTVTNAMTDGTEHETLQAMTNDKKLTNEEVLAIARENISLRSDIIEAHRLGEYTVVMADGDNDGIADLIAEEHFGGSAGLTEFAFYKGQKDGTYRKTSSYGAVQQDFCMISYDGKNYLCRTRFDYGKKIYNGISLACYVDGIQVETADLTLYPEAYDIALAECAQEQYRVFAEGIAANGLHFKEQIDSHERISGTKEEPSPLAEQYEYMCDLDNDGVAEHYNKSVWEPSNIGMSEHLLFYGEGAGIERVEAALETMNGTPMMMWVEPFQEENIVNVISLTGLHDFEITGFVLNGADRRIVYRITADVTYGVQCEIGTQMNE